MKLPKLFWWSKKAPPNTSVQENKYQPETPISPGRVSVEEDDSLFVKLRGTVKMVEPSFRVEVIKLIRDLYKVNPDVGIALQDMFKLANTGHNVTFPNNDDSQAEKMRDHLREATSKWSRYTAGVDGLVNKMMVQLLIGGAVSVEGVPNEDLTGLATVLFIKPESIIFKRESNGVYSPYQRNMNSLVKTGQYIKLNPETYFYAGMYNDTDEPYGIPPFMAALDSLKGQSDMKTNFKHIMEIMGMVGFLEAKMEKSSQRPNESINAYEARLNRDLIKLKKNLKEGMKDGIVTGYIDDHEFKLNSTTKELGNIEIPWNMNQQSVANGLGVSGSIIGVSDTSGEAASGTMLSKMIAQLKNLQTIVGYILEKLYLLELRLAGFEPKGIRIIWNTSTISDEVKVQQGLQYKIQNLDLLYKAGIISQDQYAWEMGYDAPDQDEPRLSLEDQNGVNNDPQEGTKKKQRQSDKNQSARRSRDKGSSSGRRHDTDTKPR